MSQFADIIGQKEIVGHLQNAMQTGSVSHAYIFSGAKGSGRRTLARTFAQALQCEHPQKTEHGLEPCGNCHSCRQAESGNHPDIITVTHERPGSIGIDDIRSMRSDVQILPYESERKIYIVPDAEKMTVQAQNALLKTIEEPPDYAVIILLADGTAAFLPTVLSRCIVLRMRPVRTEAIAGWLRTQKGMEAGQADFYARLADGSIGRAARLSEDAVFADLREETVKMLRDISRMDAAAVYDMAKKITEAGQTEDFLMFIRMWIRDVLVIKSTGEAQHLIFAEEMAYSRECARRISYAGLQRANESLDQAQRRLKANCNAELTVEVMLLTLRSSFSNT